MVNPAHPRFRPASHSSNFSLADLATIFRDHPRIALAMFCSVARETAMFGEHLADVGWRSAYERLAHFLLEMATRLRAISLSDGSTFDLPLTQAKLADVLGLSIPHVNRMLRRLREDGLIEMAGPRVRIIDRPALAALADFNDAYSSGAHRQNKRGAATDLTASNVRAAAATFRTFALIQVNDPAQCA